MVIDKNLENEIEIDPKLLELSESIQEQLNWENTEFIEVKDSKSNDEDDDIDDLLLNTLEGIDDIEDEEESLISTISKTKKDLRKEKRAERKALRKNRRETRRQLRADRRAKRKEKRQERRLNPGQRGGILRMFKEKLISLALKSLKTFRVRITETNILTLSLDKLIVFLEQLSESDFAKDLEKGKLTDLSPEIDKKIDTISETIGNKLYDIYKVIMEIIPGFKILKLISTIITPFLIKNKITAQTA